MVGLGRGRLSFWALGLLTKKKNKNNCYYYFLIFFNILIFFIEKEMSYLLYVKNAAQLVCVSNDLSLFKTKEAMNDVIFFKQIE